jgi:hypothetical protein
MHKMGSADDRFMDDDHFPNDGGTIHDPAFHDRLNHMMNHRALQDGLYDLSLNNTALNNGTNDVPLDNPPLDARVVIVVLHHNLSASRSIFKSLIIVQRVASPKLRGSGTWNGYGGGRIGECGDASYSEGLPNSSQHFGLP